MRTRNGFYRSFLLSGCPLRGGSTRIQIGGAVTEIRDCLARKIGELDETTGFFSSRFGTDGYEGYVPIGKSVAIRHAKSKTFIHRVAETQYEFTSRIIA